MVSAELGHLRSDLILLPDVTRYGGTWLRKPGTTVSRLEEEVSVHLTYTSRIKTVGT